MDQKSRPEYKEIRSRLIERGLSQSSQNGSIKAANLSQQKLAGSVVNESLYFYAIDTVNGGMALSEQWNFTLVQPSDSSKGKAPAVRR